MLKVLVGGGYPAGNPMRRVGLTWQVMVCHEELSDGVIDVVLCCLQGLPKGRLMMYDPATQETVVLAKV